jgi:hypothetical protein
MAISDPVVIELQEAAGNRTAAEYAACHRGGKSKRQTMTDSTTTKRSGRL